MLLLKTLLEMENLMIIILIVCVTCQLTFQINQDDNRNDDGKCSKKVTKRQRSPMLSEKEYTMALSLLRRQSPVPVDSRTSLQNNLYRKISMFKMVRSFVHDPYLGKKVPRILIDEKILLPANEIDPCVESYYKSSKGDGAKKLTYSIRSNYYGIGEKKIQACLNKMDTHRSKQPRFENKAPLRYITAKTVMERHQIDLVDLSSIAVTSKGTKYRYVLSILDVFSRFLWLRAVPDKSAASTAFELYKLYIEFGPPRILQSDQGSEFKGVVQELCSLLKTKLIYSSSGHPQSQGKAERSHRTWKEKLRQDILSTQTGGVCDWVTGLPVLQRIYNEGWHRSIRMTPYECMFGVKSNHILERLSNSDMPLEGELDIEEISDIYSEVTHDELQTHLNIVKQLRQQASDSSKNSSEKMVRSNLTKKPPSKYVVGDKVLVKHIGKDKRVTRGGKSIKAPKAIEGTVVQSNFANHKYRIEFTNSFGKSEKKWFSVDLLTSKSYEIEKAKKTNARKEKQSNINYKKPKIFPKRPTTLLMQSSQISIIQQLQTMIVESIRIGQNSRNQMTQLLSNAERHNLELHSDNDGNGNCMFLALRHQLLTHGIDIDNRQIRQQLVSYLRENPVLITTESTVDFRNFIHDSDGWDEYLNNMKEEGIWGDNLILIAAANVFNSRIVIISSLPNGNDIIINPIGEPAHREIYLGHLHELHYVSLMQSENIVNDALCDKCGKMGPPMTHNCIETGSLVSDIDTMPTFPLDTIQKRGLLNSVNGIIEDIASRFERNDLCEQNKKETGFCRLARDHNSLLWAMFMDKAGFSFENDIIENEMFLKVQKPFMVWFDEFREKLKIICGTMALIYLTCTVKMWLDQLEKSFKDDVQEICPRVYLMTRRAMDDFYHWIQFQDLGDHAGVETVDESDES